MEWREKGSHRKIGDGRQCGVPAWEARGEDACRMGHKIRTRACECELEEVVQRYPAKHGAEHQPGHRGPASQEQISYDRKCYDPEHNRTAQTCYVSRRFVYPCWDDGSRGVRGGQDG